MDLMQEVKDECGISWSDEDTDRRVSGIIVRAKAILDRHAGEPCDYDADGTARQLLCSLCRYIYNNAVEEFKQNFSGELVDLRISYETRRAMSEEAEDDAGT